MLKKTLTLAALLAGLVMPALASDDGPGHRARYEHGRYEHDGGRCSARPAAEWKEHAIMQVATGG